MPSPFPGMNPYLERARAWKSFHSNFISTAHFQIAAQLPPSYLVQIEERVYIHEAPLDDRFIGSPDVSLSHPSQEPMSWVPPAGSVVAPSYVTVLDAVETERIGYIEIRDRDNDNLITAIELLSPTNKYAGPDREQYLGKRKQLLRSPAHFVEIDLLRGGPRMPPAELPTCDYCAIVSRVQERPRAGVWSWKLRDLLTPIPIPLRSPDSDANLDLKEIIDRVYDAGKYERYIYKGLPEPRLAPTDAAWATGLIPITA